MDGFAVDGQRRCLVDSVDEELVRILRDPQLTAVDGQQVVAFFDHTPGSVSGERRLPIPIFARINLREPIHSAGGIGRKVGAEKADVDCIDLRIIATANVGVGVGELPIISPKTYVRLRRSATKGSSCLYLSCCCCQLTPFMEASKK